MTTRPAERTALLSGTPRNAAHGRPSSSDRRRVGAIVTLMAAAVMLLAVTSQYRSFYPQRLTNELLTAATTQAASFEFELNPDGSPNVRKLCQEKWHTQTLDHFDTGAPTYRQRYFVCDQFYREDKGVMFFYVGNEADVELYLNHTGLMWENAAEFGAMLVFAEHRYFGKSIPFGGDMLNHIEYLSIEQALADYAELIAHIKQSTKRDIPVIGFGGSYGGMLGSWFRMKYPHIIDGVIAASAPILQFLGDEEMPDIGSYARLVTFDASPSAGAAENCVPNIRRVWPTIRRFGSTPNGRKDLRALFSLCHNAPLKTADDVENLIEWAKGAFDSMAMGNYPYPSSYIMNGQSELPAYPMRAACSHVANSFAPEHDFALLQAFSRAIGVYYNSSHDVSCYALGAASEESGQDANLWDYLFCSQAYGPLSQDGVHDMFWDAPWDYAADNASCQREWGVDADRDYPTDHFGGRKAVRDATNIVFSNGDYDPCAGTSVLKTVSDSVVAVRIKGAAHHLDLMFSNPLDPPALLEAREIEKSHMHKWVREFYEH